MSDPKRDVRRLQRYQPKIKEWSDRNSYIYQKAGMEEYPWGSYVKHEDHCVLVAELQARIKKLEENSDTK